MLSVAVSWDLYTRTKSALVLGNVGFVQVAPYLLFALFAGQIADTHDRRRILLVTQLLLLAASAALAVTGGSVISIYSCLFLTAVARTFQGPARGALLPRVVPPEALRNAVTWNSSAWEIANLAGPALAGVLLAMYGPRTAYLTQCVCAVLSLGCFAALGTYAHKESARRAPGWESLLGGITFLRRHELLLAAVSLDLLAVLFGGATALLPIYAAEILHTDASGLGWLRAAPSMGAAAMALFSAHRLRFDRAGRALLLAVAAFGVATVVFAVSRSFWLSMAMLVLAGAFDNISVVLRHSLLQTETPDALRGRVLAVNNIFISCSNQLGAVESGWAAALLGVVPSVVAGGLATIAIAGAFAVGSKSLREWRQNGLLP